MNKIGFRRTVSMEKKGFLILAIGVGALGVIVGGYSIYSYASGLLQP